VLAVVLGVIVAAALYFAYLWPRVPPLDDAALDATSRREPLAEEP